MGLIPRWYFRVARLTCSYKGGIRHYNRQVYSGASISAFAIRSTWVYVLSVFAYDHLGETSYRS